MADDNDNAPVVQTGMHMGGDADLCIFSARRNSGKTHLLTWMLSRAVATKRYSMIAIMCPTSFNGHYQRYTRNIIAGFDEQKIKNVTYIIRY